MLLINTQHYLNAAIYDSSTVLRARQISVNTQQTFFCPYVLVVFNTFLPHLYRMTFFKKGLIQNHHKLQLVTVHFGIRTSFHTHTWSFI